MSVILDPPETSEVAAMRQWNVHLIAQYLRRHISILADSGDADLHNCCHVAPSGGAFTLVPNHLFHATPEIFIQLGGLTRFNVPGESFDLEAGKVAIIPTGVPHQEYIPHSRDKFVNLVLMFSPTSMSAHIAFSSAFGRPQGGNMVKWRSPTIPRIIAYAEDITASRGGSVPLGARGEASLLRVLWLTILAILDGTPVTPQRYSHRINQCCNLVQTQLSDPALSVSFLAEQLNCAADYLSHQFSLETGERLTRYINRRRTFAAESLLQSTTLTVAEIAYAVGFHQPGYFIRIFREFHQTTPGEFRKMLPSKISPTNPRAS